MQYVSVVNFFQDCINRLEINGRIYKKRGKNAFFFINPIVQNSKKTMSGIMWKKLTKPLNHLQQLKKYNLLLTKFLEIFKTTPNMPTINTPLLYRKDYLDGHSSNGHSSTDGRFFYEEILFLRKELDHKQELSTIY